MTDETDAQLAELTARGLDPRDRVAVEMVLAMPDPRPAPALKVICSAPMKHGKPCGRRIASVWKLSDGLHTYKTQMITSRAGRTAQYEELLRLREAGVIDSNDSAISEQEIADQTPTPMEGVLERENRDLVNGAPCVPLGCPKHGNIRVGAAWLAGEAASTRAKVDVNVLGGWMRYDPANPSEG